MGTSRASVSSSRSMSTVSPAATPALLRTSLLTPSMNLPPMTATVLRYVKPLMVARTGGRLLDPRAATTCAGTSTPAAVLPAGRILVRNLIALRPGRLGLGPDRGLPGELHDAQVVAERVAETEVDAIRVLGGLFGDFDPAGLQRLVGLLAVVRGKADREAARALADQLANLRR